MIKANVGDRVTVWRHREVRRIVTVTRATKTQIVTDDGKRWTRRTGLEVGRGGRAWDHLALRARDCAEGDDRREEISRREGVFDSLRRRLYDATSPPWPPDNRRRLALDDTVAAAADALLAAIDEAKP